MKKITFLFLMTLLPLMVSADAINIDDIFYNLDFSTKTAEVTSNPNKYFGSVDIPASVTFKGSEYSVTSIGANAFQSCKDLISASIPNSVTSIGKLAFNGCSGLTSIDIPNSVTEIGNYSFSDCSGLTSIIIPNGVISIEYYAFWGCIGLISITIPNSVISIGERAFAGCSDLTSISVEKENPKYDSRNNCNAIIETATNTLITGCQNTIIPNSVTSIGDHAFVFCSNLTSVTIPNSVTSIGELAFNGCSGLTSVTIPNSVTSIGGYAFSLCSSLTSITIPNSVISIGRSAFSECSSLTSIDIPNSVTSIGDRAFYGCSGLTSIDIPNSVTSIGKLAFNGCSGLTSIDIPNSVTEIGYRAFYDCSGLTSVTIPNGVKIIEYNAFGDCTGLTSVTIPSSVTSIGENAFYNCSGLTSVTIPNSVMSIGEHAFAGCSDLTDVYCYAENVPTTSNYVFYKTNISNGILHVPEFSVSTYKSTAPWSEFGTIKGILPFIDGIYYSLNTNTKQATVKSGDTKYKGDVVIPSSITFNETEYSVTCIGDSAFYGCFGLTSLSIPNTITSIGNAAIANCKELAEVYCYAEQVPTTGNDVFKGSYIDYVTLYVPESSINTYKFATPWNGFGSIIALPEPTLRGDVNDDGVVNGTDIQAIINLIVESLYDEKGDVNEDGNVNGTDIQEVINIIVNAE